MSVLADLIVVKRFTLLIAPLLEVGRSLPLGANLIFETALKLGALELMDLLRKILVCGKLDDIGFLIAMLLEICVLALLEVGITELSQDLTEFESDADPICTEVQFAIPLSVQDRLLADATGGCVPIEPKGNTVSRKEEWFPSQQALTLVMKNGFRPARIQRSHVRTKLLFRSIGLICRFHIIFIVPLRHMYESVSDSVKLQCGNYNFFKLPAFIALLMAIIVAFSVFRNSTPFPSYGPPNEDPLCPIV